MIKEGLLYAVVLLTSIPIGLFLAWLCSDELFDGRRWFKLILYSLVIVFVVILLVYRNIPIMLSLVYMIIITLISLYKGKQ